LLLMSQLIPHFGLEQPLFGFRPRWVEGRDDYGSVEEMAREFLAELRIVQPKGPYQLGGHCVGGIAALEIAQLLLQEGEEIKMMLFLDTERPTALRTFFTELYFLHQRARHIRQVISEIFHANRGRRGEMIRKLLHRKFNETDKFYQSKVVYRRLLYRHKTKHYPGRIALIINEAQARVDRDLGWTGIPRDGLDIYTVPGAHYTVLDHHAKEVAEVILECMGEMNTTSIQSKPERTVVNAL
jgi:thioesterase domain-containing protein